MTDPNPNPTPEREALTARWERLMAELEGEIKELRADAGEGLDKLDLKIQEWRDESSLDEQAVAVWDDVEAKARSVWADLKAEFGRRTP